MAHYAIEMNDGTVRIMLTVAGADPFACIKQWSGAEQLKVKSVSAIQPADIPRDRAFRNAWMMEGGRVGCDLAKAREIHRESLRRQRAPFLVALDADYLRADEVGDNAEKKRIAAKKQALRDATKYPAIDAAQTVEALKAAIPDVLKQGN